MTFSRHFIGCCAAVLCAAAAVPQQVRAQYDHGPENTFRLATYNIHNGLNADGSAYNYERQAQVLEQMNADIIAVQEVDSASRRSALHYPLGEYGYALGMRAYYSPTIELEGGKYGLGLLTKKKPLSVRRIALPGREEPRTAVIAEYPYYRVCATHLSLNEEDRMAALKIICQEAEQGEKPFFLAGDLNTTLQEPSGKFFAEKFTTMHNLKYNTFPAGEPTAVIDFLAVYKKHDRKIVVFNSDVVDEPAASDHRPVLADIRVSVPTREIFYSEPYIQNFTDDGITVMYQTNVVTHTWVEYGTDTANLKKARTVIAGQEPVLDIENKVRIEGLRPGVKYFYRVCAQEMIKNHSYHKILGDTVKTRFYSFTLPSPDTDKFTMAVFNDLHESYDVMDALYGVLQKKGIKSDFIVYNGDSNTEPDSRSRAIQLVNRLTSAAGGAERPVFIIRGNHEIRNSYSAGMVSLTDNFDGLTYGAFSWGDTRFVILDCGEDKKDTDWVYYDLNDFSQLRQDQAVFLAKEVKSKEYKKAKRHILIQHIPIWGDEKEDIFTNAYHPWTKLWDPVLKKAKFDVDITAHAHFYYLYEPGDMGNPCLAVGGGGPRMNDATVMVLTKNGKELRLQVFDTQGKTILDRQL